MITILTVLAYVAVAGAFKVAYRDVVFRKQVTYSRN